MQPDNVRVSSSPVFHQDSEPFVYISKSTPSRDGALLCSSDSHSSGEEIESPKSAEPSARPGPPQQRPCPQDDHDWVCIHPSNCYSSCTCGILLQSAIFPDTLLACAQTSVSGKCGTERQTQNEYCLQKTSGCDTDDGETGPLCRCEGCSGPRHYETVERPCSPQHDPEFPTCPKVTTLAVTQHSREMTKSPLGMKGGCSLFGMGTDSDKSGEQGGRESKRSSHGDDLYLREMDEMGITCLSYNPSALTSRTFADDFCRLAGRHSARKERRPHCQRPLRIDSDHSCGGVATGAWKSEGGRVRKSGGTSVQFPRDNSSWLNSATRDKLREFPCPGKRQSRNKPVIPGFHKQGCEGADPIGLGPFLREDTWWRSRLVGGAYPQSGAEPRLRAERCTRKTDDIYIYEVDDTGTSSLFYKQRPSSCGVSDNDGNLCGKKGHHKDTCQHLSCKRCKSQPVPGRTRCSLCSDDTSSLMSLKQGDCHTSTFRTNGGSAPIIYSLPQWPRYLLLQNSGAQATTAVYKD